MSAALVYLGVPALAGAAYWCGRLHEQWLREQVELERPADWVVEMSHSDPQRLINTLRQRTCREAPR